MTKFSKTVLIVFFTTLISCKKDTMISFYVKNTFEKPVSFTVTELGSMDSFSSFTIKPKDSVLITEVNVKYITPEKCINNCYINLTDSTEIRDSSNKKNWLKSITKDGKMVYTFNIIKK